MCSASDCLNPRKKKSGSMTNHRTQAEISALRAAAGRKGAEARWKGHTRQPTELVRIYKADAETLRGRASTMAAAIHMLLDPH